MEAADAWLATDKLYHVLLCFSLTVLFSVLANRIRYPFVRRWSMSIGSSLSLLVAGAKETADQFGFFHSAGASAKDAVADFFGVLIDCEEIDFPAYEGMSHVLIGQLAMTRAFGDLKLKDHITSEPDVWLTRMDEDAKFFILASDGSWKVDWESGICLSIGALL
ncbi:hypothetical protein Nepgr_019543 [Nepenthes gracilis]|uniref:PPM-type phosphatase domain-containing protein n=1 Tax=Nepenthes gracilis TaxID=150966 RepID=A0AAD3SWB1_NEPGR|nr:hypothetical protein Nepgr_019543 [Nepenthes gracilis]